MKSITLGTLPNKTNDTLATDELLRNLGRFPSSVLPTGLLRELQFRGDAIHDALVRRLKGAIDSADNRLGSKCDNVSYAFALLVTIATNDDRPLIESLLKMSDTSIHDLIGDLVSEAMPRFVANFFKTQNASEVMEWLDRLVGQLEPESLNVGLLYRALTIAATIGYLDRTTAINVLVDRLERRADQRNDLQSALIVCELMELSAGVIDEVNVIVCKCFGRNQIDTSYVDISSWNTTEWHGRTLDEESIWIDTAETLSTWCYDFVCDDLDPVGAKFRVNEQSGHRLMDITDSSLSDWIDELRQSTDNRFPQDAVESINLRFPYAFSAIIDLIRAEIARIPSDAHSWSGNGAYLGLVLTVANKMPLPIDLLESILQLPERDRELVFGDQFGLIVQSIALTPLPQLDFVEQWIWDVDRGTADRREMVDVYLSAHHNGLLDREAAIDALVAGLRRALGEAPSLIAPYAENLAYLSPPKHSQLLEDAFKFHNDDWFLSLGEMSRMIQDPEFALEKFDERSGSYRHVDMILEEGVMFDHAVHTPNPQTLPSLASHSTLPRGYQPQLEYSSTSTIRNEEVRTSRNDPCPCGSGKKYKKCCLNK